MKLNLQILTGSKVGQCIEIGDKQTRTIGRSSAAQISFPDDEHMSGVHCEIENRGDSAELRDCRSRNKTWLNNQQVASAVLKSGDRIRAGKTVFCVEFELDTSVEHAQAQPVERPGLAPTPRTLSDAVPLPDLMPDIAPVTPPTPPRYSSWQAPADIPSPLPHFSSLSSATPEKANGRSPIEATGREELLNVAKAAAGQLGSSESGIEPDRRDNPISDSISWYYDPESSSVITPAQRRRFRVYERAGDFQTAYNLRTVINALKMKKTVRVIAHFAKIRMLTPGELSTAAPVYPTYPGGLTHLPIILEPQDWDSNAVQGVATRLCANDALIVLVADFNTDLNVHIQSVGATGVNGFCEEGGFLGWCWPSAFMSLSAALGIYRWSEILGSAVEGAIMYSPIRPELLLAFASDSLGEELGPLGFTPEP